MRAVKTLTVGAQTFEVRELTVADIRLWLNDLLATPTPDLLAEALFDELSLADLPRMTSLTVERIEQMTPAELRQVIDAVKAVNGDFRVAAETAPGCPHDPAHSLRWLQQTACTWCAWARRGVGLSVCGVCCGDR